MANKVWVAKCSDNLGKLFEFELSPRFADVQECQKFIDEHCQIMEFLLDECFNKILYGGHYENGVPHYKFCIGGRFIRCYNVQQKRFCDGFDF